MPNWCNNFLEITGDATELNEFKDRLPSLKLSFNALLPIPAIIDPQASNQWFNEHWGTKWDVGTAGVDFYECIDNLLSYEFETAWSPPEELLLTVSAQHPNLHFTNRFAEPGVELVGERTYQNGKLIDGYSPESPQDMNYFVYEHFGFYLYDTENDLAYATEHYNKRNTED